MPSRSRRWARGLGLGLAFGVGAGFCGVGSASAQFAAPGTGSGFGSSTASAAMMSGNPYLSPYANPFLNPAMTQQAMPPGNAALYFFAAQQATGGIGSGRLSGSRPGPATPGAAAAGRNGATDAAPRGTSNRPGAGAARYFAREFPAKAEPKGYYKRQVRQFPSIGR